MDDIQLEVNSLQEQAEVSENASSNIEDRLDTVFS